MGKRFMGTLKRNELGSAVIGHERCGETCRQARGEEEDICAISV